MEEVEEDITAGEAEEATVVEDTVTKVDMTVRRVLEPFYSLLWCPTEGGGYSSGGGGYQQGYGSYSQGY